MYIFLSSPYTDVSPVTMTKRFLLAEKACVLLIQQGHIPFSPIVHCHGLATKYDLPKEAAYWSSYNRAMLNGAAELYILAINGWSKSVGLRAEVKIAKENKLPIRIMTLLDATNSFTLELFNGEIP